MTNITESPDFIYIWINTFPPLGSEEVKGGKGIIRHYGRDGDRKKLNYVMYPTKHYTRKYVEENILQQYDNCRLCNIGTLITPTSKIKPMKKISPIKINNEGLKFGLTVGILSTIPILLLILKEKLTKQES